ncbi:MAG: nitroreductase family protein [Candidatus Bathyarchaeota archaeon]|nr:nitroreductase family protein [Candidatus Bathyarchaeota archaeon]MDH5792389.1 nitroreductase family protein [Candidatus Bathyarchaeota archaeon]
MRIPDIIRERKSVRAFTAQEVSDEEAETLVEAACLAPSAGNLQPWEFVVVRDPGVKNRLVDAAHGQSFISEAPVVFVVCAVPGRSASGYGSRGRELYCLQDTAAAVQNLLLTATANGLGSCWIGAFDEGRAADALGLPEGVRPVAIVPVGYPAESPRQRPRRPVKQVTHWDRW